MARALYRSRQVWHALLPRVDAQRLSQALQLLNDAQAELFLSMPRRDQRHALEVYARLRAAMAADRDLLTAALLHDCGKGAVPVWLRILFVLRPALVRRLAREGTTGVRAAAWRLAHHEVIGSKKARDAGAGATAVRLIGGKPLPQEQALLDTLRRADDAS